MKIRKLIIFLAFLTFGMVQIGKWRPQTVESFYSMGIYPWISRLFRIFFGWLPFSVGDILYLFLAIRAIYWMVKNFSTLRKKTQLWIWKLTSGVAFIYILFHLLWGFNYYRVPLHKKLNIKETYTIEELEKVSQWLIAQSNEYQLKLTGNDTLQVNAALSKNEILKSAPKGYQDIEEVLPFLAYKYSSVKKSLFSLPLTYMGFSGYLNPFSLEAQVDKLIPSFRLPTTTNHEIAHQLGYAAENEANFIGFMATINHPESYFKYSGYSFGLAHCLNEIKKADPEKYKKLISTIHKGVLKNYQEYYNFWQSYKNPLEPLFKSSYDIYLKSNSQVGIQSYSYVVALIVNYYQTKS